MSRKQAPSCVTEKAIFATRLRELMETPPKTSQETLAAAIGVTRQAVSNYKSGQSSPDWETVAKIARFFKVSSDFLLGLSDAPSTDVNLRAICEYTGLSPGAVFILNSVFSAENVYPDVVNARSIMDDFIIRYGESVGLLLSQLRSETYAAEVIISDINIDVLDHAGDRTHIKDALRSVLRCSNQVELAFFRFSKLWSSIADTYNTQEIIDELTVLKNQLLWSNALLTYNRRSNTGDTDNGEHKED